MNLFLTFAFLFFIGSVSGWILELIFRKFFSASNPEHKWINPGFCTGPYLPIYGFGLCVLYFIASLEKHIFISEAFLNKLIIFIVMGACMTVIEYVTGVWLLKTSKVRLWDYRNQWGNVQGIICPKFSFFWAVLGILYYCLIHPHILHILGWLSNNLAFSFVIGLFFGVFIIDAAQSTQLVAKLKRYATENDVIVVYEEIKAHIIKRHEENRQKRHFFYPFKSDVPLSEHLKELRDSFETYKQKFKGN